jgi:hypothetical protein
MGKAVAKLSEVEVGGKRFLVDMTGAKVVDEFKIGDPVKVLTKRYNDEYDTNHGMIIGFDAFENLPTIIIADFEHRYGNEAELKVVNYNRQTTGVEICHATPAELKLDPQAVIDHVNMSISKLRNEIRELQNKKDFFLRNFSKVFGIDTATIVDEMDAEEGREL